MRRREVIKLIAALGAISPSLAVAQSALPIVGFLNSSTPDGQPLRLQSFHRGLNEVGFVEGQNVVIEYRWAENQFQKLPGLADDLVRRRVTVIAAGYNAAAVLAAKAATSTIPIVFQTGVDPVKAGLIASLSRPGGNLTGATNASNEIVPKRLQILHELVPAATAFALLVNPSNPASSSDITSQAQKAGNTIGVQVHVLRASTDGDLESAFVSLRQLGVGALMISPDSFFSSRNAQLAALALRHNVPTSAPFREYAIAGGPMSYGGSDAEQARQAGIYTGRILKGERPADLPVLQVTKVELTINLKTAKALGLTIPLPLLGRADEVIE